MSVQSKYIDIAHVVALKQFARKWKKLASVRKAAHALGRKLLFWRSCRITFVSGNTQVDVGNTQVDVVGLNESSNGHRRSLSAIPPDVPLGHLAVYVGQHCNMRYVIPAAYLNHQVFRALLKQAEEEFGYAARGGLAIPCDEFLFEHILRLFSRNGLAAVSHLDLEAVKSNFCNEWNCSSEVNGISFGNESRRLLSPFTQKSIV